MLPFLISGILVYQNGNVLFMRDVFPAQGIPRQAIESLE